MRIPKGSRVRAAPLRAMARAARAAGDHETARRHGPAAAIVEGRPWRADRYVPGDRPAPAHTEALAWQWGWTPNR